MRNHHKVNGPQDAGRGKLVLNAGFNIARQQDSPLAAGDFDNARRVVSGLYGTRPRMQHAEQHTVPGPRTVAQAAAGLRRLPGP